MRHIIGTVALVALLGCGGGAGAEDILLAEDIDGTDEVMDIEFSKETFLDKPSDDTGGECPNSYFQEGPCGYCHSPGSFCGPGNTTCTCYSRYCHDSNGPFMVYFSGEPEPCPGETTCVDGSCQPTGASEDVVEPVDVEELPTEEVQDAEEPDASDVYYPPELR